MAAKITNKLIQLPPEVSIDKVIDHPHSLEFFLSYPEQPRRVLFCCGGTKFVRETYAALELAFSGKKPKD